MGSMWSEIDADYAYANEHALLGDAMGRAVARLYRLGVADALAINEIQRRARHHRRQELIAPSPPFRAPQLSGPIDALDMHGRRIGLPVPTLAGHGLAIGSSGTGKTTQARHFALQLEPCIQGIWCFDLAKKEFTYSADVGIHARVAWQRVRGESMRLNPLQVPHGGQPSDWASVVGQTIAEALGLPRVASVLLRTAVLELYKSRGVLAGSRQYPTVREAYEFIKLMRGAHPQARQAVISALDPIVLSLGDTVLAYSIGWDTRDLASMRLSIDLSGQADDEQNLILHSLLSAEGFRRIAAGLSNVSLQLGVFVDEAVRLCRAPVGGHGESALVRALRLGRGGGMSVHLGVQDAHGIDRGILANTNAKFLFRTGSWSDTLEIGHAMGLSQDQMRYTLKLGAGVCIASFGGYGGPFIMRVPYATPTRSEASGAAWDPTSLPKALARLPVVPAAGDTFVQVQHEPQVRPAESQGEPSASSTPGSKETAVAIDSPARPVTPVLSEGEVRVLSAVRHAPLLASSEYPKQVRMSPARFQAIRESLRARGFLRLHEVFATPGRGRSKLLLELTSQGRAAIDALDPKGA